MDTPFPFGFPLPTAFYLTLFVLTLVTHVLFMNYVLAGSAYLAFAWVTGRSKSAGGGPTPASLLRDWMPFAVSAAITAGVAPLLFVQILYKHSFYTANLLLFHRWMSILPVLIVGFYLMYLLKARRVQGWSSRARGLLGLGVFLCVAWVGYSWTENHLLSMAGPDTWTEFYAQRKVAYYHEQIAPRLAVWFSGAFPVMALTLGWQMWYLRRKAVGPASSLAPADGADAGAAAVRTLTRIALLGLGVAAACVLWHAYALGKAPVTEGGLSRWSAVQLGRTTAAKPYVIVAVLGALVQVAAWLLQGRGRTLDGRWLGLATAGAILTVLGATVIREVLRIHTLGGGFEALYDQHRRASEIGGLTVFLVFAVINAGLVVWVFRTVRKGRVAEPAAA